jgi:hypothetical protein
MIPLLSEFRRRELRTSKNNDHAFTPEDVIEVVKAYGAASFTKDDVALLCETTETMTSNRLKLSPLRPLRAMVPKLIDRVRYMV